MLFFCLVRRRNKIFPSCGQLDFVSRARRCPPLPLCERLPAELRETKNQGWFVPDGGSVRLCKVWTGPDRVTKGRAKGKEIPNNMLHDHRPDINNKKRSVDVDGNSITMFLITGEIKPMSQLKGSLYYFLKSRLLQLSYVFWPHCCANDGTKYKIITVDFIKQTLFSVEI